MKRSRIALYEFLPYGAPELLEVGESYLTRALTTATLGLAVVFLLGIGLGGRFAGQPVVTITALPRGYDLEPPPSLDPPSPAGPRLPDVSPPTGGLVTPAPDATVVDELVFPSQDELRTGQQGEQRTDGPVDPPPPVNDRPTPDVWTYYDQAPGVVTSVKPDYPDLAREAGIEGTVLLRVLVGRDGRVKDVLVEKSIPMLDEAASAAASRWIFTPALVNDHPIAVWVAIPIRFRLH